MKAPTNRPRAPTDRTLEEQIARINQAYTLDIAEIDRLIREVAELMEENQRLRVMLDFARSLTMYDKDKH
jgi:cell shape-determining protein MreC